MKAVRKPGFSIVFSLLALAGCADLPTSVAPPRHPAGQTLSVQINPDPSAIAWEDRPQTLAVFKIPDTRIVLIGYGPGALSAGRMMGPAIAAGVGGGAGIGIANAATSRGVDGPPLTNEVAEKLRFDVDTATSAVIRKLSTLDQYRGRFVDTPTSDVPKILVAPTLVLGYSSLGHFRPLAVVRADLMDARGRRVWGTRYVAPIADARPLSGPGSWAEDPGALQSAMDKGLHAAVRTMLTDFDTPLPRDESRMFVAQTYLPYSARKLEIWGFKLAEDDHTVSISAPHPSYVGVFVLEKSLAKIRPAGPDDWHTKVVPD